MKLLVPPPSDVFAALFNWIQSGDLRIDVQASLSRMLMGLLLGGAIGVSFGLLTARIGLLGLSLGTIIQLLRPLPPVAIIPLVLVYFGVGDTSKIFSVASATFFPVWINVHLGALSIPRIYLWNSQILCKSKLKELCAVIVPATLPHIVTGLRSAISIAFIMIYVSEIAGASAGIGYRISVSHLAYKMDLMIASLFLLAMTGAVVDYVFSKSVEAVFPWIRN